MAKKEDLKVGDKVRHRFRDNKWQKCTIVKIEGGINGGVRVDCEDGFYGVPDKNILFVPYDLAKVEKK